MNEITQEDELTSDSPKCVFTGVPINNFGSLKDVRKNGIDGVNTLAGPVHKMAIAAYTCLLDEVRDALRDVAGLGAIEAMPKGVSDMIPGICKTCIEDKIHPKEAIQKVRFQIATTMKDVKRSRMPIIKTAQA